MKKFFITFTIALSLVFASCSSDNETSKLNNNVQKNNLEISVNTEKEAQNSKLSKSNEDIKFDLDNVKETFSNKETAMQIFTAYEFNYSEKNPVKHVMNFIVKKGVVVDKFIVKTQIQSSTLKVVDFYETSWDKFGTFEFDTVKQTVNNTFNKKPREDKEDEGCGQAVIDCINDAYTSHGWASVALWVETAFIPEAAAVIAIVCWDKNC